VEGGTLSCILKTEDKLEIRVKVSFGFVLRWEGSRTQ